MTTAVVDRCAQSGVARRARSKREKGGPRFGCISGVFTLNSVGSMVGRIDRCWLRDGGRLRVSPLSPSTLEHPQGCFHEGVFCGAKPHRKCEPLGRRFDDNAESAGGCES